MFAPHPLVNRLSTKFCGKYMHLKIQCQSSELHQLSPRSNMALNFDILAGKFCRSEAVSREQSSEVVTRLRNALRPASAGRAGRQRRLRERLRQHSPAGETVWRGARGIAQ